MSAAIHITLAWHDWLNLFGHYLLLSLMSLGGAISTTSEMHRFLVEQHGWLTQAQFNDSIALAQAAPGPNVLFVALMGWNVGMNAGSTTAALLGVLVTMSGILLPSTVFTYMVAQWGHRNRLQAGHGAGRDRPAAVDELDPGQFGGRRWLPLAALAARAGQLHRHLAHEAAPAVGAGPGRAAGSVRLRLTELSRRYA
jgi:hypothetical protein